MKRHHWLLLFGFILLGLALFVILLIVTAPAAVAPTLPHQNNLDDETLRVASSLYCPVCPGVPLDVCDTQACAQWRALIHDKLAAGQTQEQIQEYFVAQYGERVLGAPRPQGFNLLIYLAPVVALVAGGGILGLAARSWMRTRGSPEAAAVMPDDLRERIERELKESQ